MQLFDVIPQDFFKPLTGINRHKYMDIIMLIWLHCKRNPIYGESKSVILDWLEDYFAQLVNLHEMGRIEFQKYETILLLILRLLYVEKRETLSVSEQLVLVSVEEIEGEYNKLNLPRKLDRRMLEAALRTFKKYNLALMLDRLDNSSARIQIFPSVMLAMPEPAITKAYAQTREYLLKYEKANSNSGMEGQADD